VSETFEARKTRLDCEKKEKDNKLNIARLLLSMGFKSCDIGTFSVDVKVGKNGNPLVDLKEK
jgi:hypothetical protein